MLLWLGARQFKLICTTNVINQRDAAPLCPAVLSGSLALQLYVQMTSPTSNSSHANINRLAASASRSSLSPVYTQHSTILLPVTVPLGGGQASTPLATS